MAEPDARKGGRPLNAASPPPAARLSRVKLFLALSPTPHGLLDLATPALAAALFNRANTYPLGEIQFSPQGARINQVVAAFPRAGGGRT